MSLCLFNYGNFENERVCVLFGLGKASSGSYESDVGGVEADS